LGLSFVQFFAQVALIFWSRALGGTSVFDCASFQPAAPAPKILASAATTEIVD